MRSYSIPLLLLLVGSFSIQCTNSDQKKNAKYPDTNSFCMGWAQAECSDAVLTACLASGSDACVAQRQAACISRMVTPADEAQLSYDSGAAEACVNAVRSTYADAKISSTERRAIRDTCDLVFSGPGQENASCNTNSDCQQGEGLRCVFRSSSSGDAGVAAGSCQVPLTASPGASCSAAEAQCEEGYHCGSSLHCDQDAALGENCSPENPCAEGLECASGDSGGATCIPKAGVGDACNADRDCASSYCVESLQLCAETYQLSPNEPFCTPLHDQ